jgi:uncharacterized protein GlcG (DUF336 family)
MSIRTLTAMAEGMAPLFQAFRALAEDRLVPSPGGVLISREGVLVGAVGVSGDTGPNDELCAVAGVEASGLIAQL